VPAKPAARKAKSPARAPRKLRAIPEPKEIGRGPGRMPPAKKKSLIARFAGHERLRIVTEFWIDPRAPHIPGRAQVRISDPSWYFTDDPPSIGLAPYGGNSGGADLRIFFKPTLANRPHLAVFSLTIPHTSALLRTSAPGAQQSVSLGHGPAHVAFLFTPPPGWQTILLGVDAASAANRIAVHGCEITVLE
jgi:hypothetical protein